ncbi:hypothetical protein GCM10007301_42570 [Azorhizobium oxalatiphilum]|uniref:Uncharacterized protein n=1 Tax=Azorhizobium oxalatiphilum TaxID=980631 RepID=A0A917C9U4_9HYPH|nr:hypothetical protein [Azorhizobium oxalatiphilum]GGF78070.1 hypothetical protein GCM10007301_42570 [Azorhizobium oxalatiphilum]
MPASLDLAEVHYVKRIAIGAPGLSGAEADAKAADALALLNRCLSEHPKGRIIGIEKPAAQVGAGDPPVLVHWTTYHVGFARKPHWLEEANGEG